MKSNLFACGFSPAIWLLLITAIAGGEDGSKSRSVTIKAEKPKVGATDSVRFPALNNAEAWSRMPREMPALPVWARILSKPLPRATAGMLQLDYVHRAKNPLDPILRGKIRWMAAVANRCNYSRLYAEADLRRAGMTDDELKKLDGDPAKLPEADRRILAFAKKLTLAGHSITDEEFATILKQYGPEQTVAIVHTLAHANFQDRILLALGVQVEPDGPYSPLDVGFDPQLKSAVQPALRTPWKQLAATKLERPNPEASSDWIKHDYSAVQKLLAGQKQRSSRIPLPDWKIVSKKLPPELRSREPSQVIWSNISLGYQPVLTQAWFNCMRTFRQESDLDRVFANSMFWVVTRSNQCFY